MLFTSTISIAPFLSAIARVSGPHLSTAGCCSPPQPASLRFYQRSPECLDPICLQQGVVHLHNQHRSVSISDRPSVWTPSVYSRVLFTSTISIAPFLSAITRVSGPHLSTAGCCSPPQPASLRFYQRSPECLYSIRLQQGVVHLRNQHRSVSISDRLSVWTPSVYSRVLFTSATSIAPFLSAIPRVSVLHQTTAGCCSPPQPASLRFYQRSPECLYSIRLQQGVVHLRNQHRSVSISDRLSVWTPSVYSRVLFTSATSIAPFLSAIPRVSVLHQTTAGCCSPPQPALLRFYQRSPECLYSIRLQQGVVHLHNQHRSVSISDRPSVCTPSDYSRVLFTSATSIPPFLSAIPRVSVLHLATAGCCSPPQPALLRFYQRSPECLYSIRLQQGVVHFHNQHRSVSISDHPSVCTPSDYSRVLFTSATSIPPFLSAIP